MGGAAVMPISQVRDPRFREVAQLSQGESRNPHPRLLAPSPVVLAAPGWTAAAPVSGGGSRRCHLSQGLERGQAFLRGGEEERYLAKRSCLRDESQLRG